MKEKIVEASDCICKLRGGNMGAKILNAAIAAAVACAASAAEPVGKVRPRPAGEVKQASWTIGCEVLDRELAVFREYRDYLPGLGIKRIRLQGGWARCEREKGKYDFSWLDEPVDFCAAHGMTVLLETSYGNPIYEGAGGWDLGAGFPKSEEGLAAWDRWVEALAKHFKGRVTDWAMWNEPDLKITGGGRKTPEEIGVFNVRTAKIIKRVIPDAKIAALSLAHNNPEFLEGCLKAMEGNFGLFTSVIYHGYSANPDDSYEKVAQQKEVLARYAPHLRLQQGENGAPSSLCTAYALKDIPWNELSQAKWDVRRMLGDLGHDVDSSVFTIIEYTQENRPKNTKGLLAATDDLKVAKAKPAYYAVRNVASVFDSSVVRVKDAEVALPGAKRAAAFLYSAPGGRIVTYWDASSRPDETLHPASGSVRVKAPPFRDPVLVDMVTGEVFALPAGQVREEGGFTVYSGVPVHDYPWLLAERRAIPLCRQ